MWAEQFQSTRPHEARQPVTTHIAAMPRFNPRAHTRRDSMIRGMSKGMSVSIHAPTRGATGALEVRDNWQEFQSTRPHEARLEIVRKLAKSLSFNPRAHTRRDVVWAYAWSQYQCFNPRAHTRRDLRLLLMLLVIVCFNPRAHTRRDSSLAISRISPGGFNPRAHTRRDHRITLSLAPLVVSIHAPTRGATA